MSDKALESTVLGQQIFGGHGFIREWGQEQLVRDVRITQIYEGTNGIQAMDLIGRKIIPNGGAYLNLFVADVHEFLSEAEPVKGAEEFTAPLVSALENLQRVTTTVIEQAQQDPNIAGSVANDYLHLFGLTVLGYMWARMAVVSLTELNGDDADFYAAKLAVARFYFARQLPQVQSLSANVIAGSESIMSMQEAWF